MTDDRYVHLLRVLYWELAEVIRAETKPKYLRHTYRDEAWFLDQMAEASGGAYEERRLL